MGVPYMWDFLTRMLPPNWAFIEKLWGAALESLYIAIWGTILGVVMALPFTSSPRATSRRIPRLPSHAPDPQRDARHQRDHSRADFCRRGRPRSVRRRAGARVHGAGMLVSSSPRRSRISTRARRGVPSAGVGRFKTVVFGILPQVLPPGSAPSSTAWRAMCGRRPCSAWLAPAASVSTRRQHEAVSVPGHGHLHSRDPRDGAADGLVLLAGARPYPLTADLIGETNEHPAHPHGLGQRPRLQVSRRRRRSRSASTARSRATSSARSTPGSRRTSRG